MDLDGEVTAAEAGRPGSREWCRPSWQVARSRASVGLVPGGRDPAKSGRCLEAQLGMGSVCTSSVSPSPFGPKRNGEPAQRQHSRSSGISSTATRSSASLLGSVPRVSSLGLPSWLETTHGRITWTHVWALAVVRSVCLSPLGKHGFDAPTEEARPGPSRAFELNVHPNCSYRNMIDKRRQ